MRYNLHTVKCRSLQCISLVNFHIGTSVKMLPRSKYKLRYLYFHHPQKVPSYPHQYLPPLGGNHYSERSSFSSDFWKFLLSSEVTWQVISERRSPCSWTHADFSHLMLAGQSRPAPSLVYFCPIACMELSFLCARVVLGSLVTVPTISTTVFFFFFTPGINKTNCHL